MPSITAKDSLKKLLNDWGIFLGILLTPAFILSVVATFFFGYFSIKADDELVKTFSTVITAISSGLAGGIINKYALDAYKTGQVYTRGQSAVRGLKLIWGNLNSIERLIKINVSTESKKDSEYLLEFVYISKEHAINSIEEWKDILPEADIDKLIASIREVLTLESRLAEVKAELDEVKKNSSGQSESIQKLKEEKKRLESELAVNSIDRTKLWITGGNNLQDSTVNFLKENSIFDKNSLKLAIGNDKHKKWWSIE